MLEGPLVGWKEGTAEEAHVRTNNAVFQADPQWAAPGSVPREDAFQFLGGSPLPALEHLPYSVTSIISQG